MRITILSTSSRHGSNSLKLSKYLKNVLETGPHEIKICSFENIDIPMVGRGSIDPHALSSFQQNLIETWDWAELVFVVAPEYNWMTSGELINTLHQLGGKEFGHVFDNKVFAIAGVSSGRGGRLPGIELTMLIGKLINFLNKYSVISPRIFESHDTGKNLTEDGASTGNAIYEKGVADFIDYSLKIAQRWFGK